MAQLRLAAVLALTGLLSTGVYAQSASSPHPDSALRSALIRLGADLQADGFHPLRVASHIGGRFEGHEIVVRQDTVVVIGRSSERAIALADIDSVWMRRDAARGLGLVGAGACALAAVALGTAVANDPDSGGGSVVGPVIGIGIVGGAICGAGGWLIGSVIKTWRLEYARPFESST